MNFNIIGAGRLGKHIARALSNAGLGSLLGVCNKHYASAIQSCHELGFGQAFQCIGDLPFAEVVWLTCNDDAIASVVSQLQCRAGTLVIHCSGVLSSAILEPLHSQGCYVASLHPLKAFTSDYVSTNAFDGIDCIMEGDELACRWLKATFERLHATIGTIHPEAKAAYHAAACLVANYSVTLSACAEELLLESGMSHEQTQRIICSLMQGSINDIGRTKKSAKSLTGPLMRGDVKTLAMHLAAINNQAIKNLYKAAGLATLTLTALPDETIQNIQSLLVESD